jgi:3-phytase
MSGIRKLVFVAFVLATGACAELPVRSVPAIWETAPVAAVSDAAIWVQLGDSSRSIVVAASADGLTTYGLDGAERQHIRTPALSSVDLRGNLAVATSVDANRLYWFKADPETQTFSAAGETELEGGNAEGVCAAEIEGAFHVAVAFADGSVITWAAREAEDGAMALSIARVISFDTAANACVFDEENKRMFVSEAKVAVWSAGSVDLKGEPTGSKQVDSIDGGHGLVPDVRGLSLWRGAADAGFLIVSAQGGDRFVVYDRAPPHAPRGVIRVRSSNSARTDAVTGTDGADTSSAKFPGFSRGVLIVQDAKDGGGPKQNLKVVDWRDVEKALRLNR